jgi:uncharacterized protein
MSDDAMRNDEPNEEPMRDRGLEIIRDDAAGRFALVDPPGGGRLDFRQEGTKLTLVRTVVDDDLEGAGVGSALVAAALDHAVRAGLTVIPQCPFVASWLERHPDRAAQLDIAER